MNRWMTRLVLLLALAALAGPRLALAQASGEGLLREVLAAHESRQRTREHPDRRDTEDRSLALANHAMALPLATSQVDARRFTLQQQRAANQPAIRDYVTGRDASPSEGCDDSPIGMPQPPPVWPDLLDLADCPETATFAYERIVQLDVFSMAAPVRGPPILL